MSGRAGTDEHGATTAGAPPRPDVAWRLDPTWATVVRAVVRRLWPYVIEATAVPTAA